MAENHPPATTAAVAADIPGQPFYEKTRAHLHALLWKRKELERSLAAQEEAIYKKETEYLEETPGGNIIVGFDGYTKGGRGGGGGRRRVGTGGEMRVFSRSSLSWNANAESPMDTGTAQSTPVAGMAGTPLSMSFLKGEGGASNHATPTSASSGHHRATPSGMAGKKNKKSNGNGNGDDSDTDAPSNKKARTNFSVVRK